MSGSKLIPLRSPGHRRRPVPRPRLPFNALFFTLPTHLALVVLAATLGGALPAVRCSAPKRTPQIPAPRVPGMGQEEDATLAATAQTGPQMRVGTEDRTQLDVVRPHQSADATAAVPVRDALKLLLDFEC